MFSSTHVAALAVAAFLHGCGCGGPGGERPDGRFLGGTSAVGAENGVLPLPAEEGSRLVRLRKYHEAVEACTQALDRTPQDARTLLVRAVSQLALGQTDEALADCNAALRLDPENALAYCTLAEVYLKKIQTAKALANVERALAGKDCPVRAYYVRGKIHWTEYIASNRTDTTLIKRARQDVEIALQASLPEAYHLRAEMCLISARISASHNAQLGRELVRSGIADCEKAIATDPRYADVHVSLAFLRFLQAGELSAGFAELITAVRKDPVRVPGIEHLLLLKRHPDIARQRDLTKQAEEVLEVVGDSAVGPLKSRAKELDLVLQNAEQLIETLTRKGLDVPEDVAVAGEETRERKEALEAFLRKVEASSSSLKKEDEETPNQKGGSSSPIEGRQSEGQAPAGTKEMQNTGIRFDGVYREHFSDGEETRIFGYQGRYYVFSENGTVFWLAYGKLPGPAGKEKKDILWLPEKRNNVPVLIPHEIEAAQHAAAISKWLADEKNRAFLRDDRRYTAQGGLVEFVRPDGMAAKEQTLRYTKGKFTEKGASFDVFIKNEAFQSLFPNGSRTWVFVPFASPMDSGAPPSAQTR